MASSAYKVGSPTNAYRWRFKDGGGGANVRYAPVKASTTIRKGDVILYDSGSTGVVVGSTVSATAGNVQIEGTKTIAGIAAHDITTGASVTVEDSVAFYPKDKVQILCRLVTNDADAADAAAAGQTQANMALDEINALGTYRSGSGSGDYFPVMGDEEGATTERNNLKLVEFAIDSSPIDSYGLVWAELQ